MVHSDSRHLGLFTGMTHYGLGAPKFVAWSTMSGPRTFKRGDKLDVTKMEECWVLVWWAGAEGWTNWDNPWVLYLQHKPETMSLDEDGLHFEFPKSAGDVVLMPLYGYEKPPQKGHDFLAEHGLAGRKTRIKTWDWPEVLTRDPLTRIRYWAAATRELPIHCEESFSIDRANDSVIVRSHFRWRTIHDDWRTRRVKLAPLSPTLALAVKSGGCPVKFSKPWFDLDYATPYGPYFAVQGADEFDATFPVLQYVNETEASVPPSTNASPAIAAALARLRQIANQELAIPDRFAYPDPAKQRDFFSIAEDAGLSAKALPFFDDATRSKVLVNLSRYRTSLKGYLRDALPTGNDPVPERRAGFLEAIWAYAHHAADWDLIREHWPQLRKLASSAMASSWAGFGQIGSAGLGSWAADCAALARLAYKAGDMDSYNYACYLFARELIHLFVKQRGADYFRQVQPWHSMEFMDDEVFLTHLSGDARGWMMDGPKFPAATGERQFEKRWTRFNDVDVARFYRDYLKEDVLREMNWLQYRRESKGGMSEHLSGLSFPRLRSLLLNERPAEQGIVASTESTTPPSGQLATCLSILRTSHPIRYDRLIPPGEASPFVTGAERDTVAMNPALVVGVETGPHEKGATLGPSAWPHLAWPAWQTPTGGEWTFGHLRASSNGSPARIRSFPLNWNTRVVVAGWP